MSISKMRSRYQEPCILFVVYCVASLIFSWLWFRPVFWDMSDSHTFWEVFADIFWTFNEPEYMLGGGIDQLGTFWIFSSLPEILSQNGYLPDIFYPIGWDIGWHTGFAWLDGILGLPLQLLGRPTFYNLHLVFTLSSSFLGVCFLLHSILKDNALASIQHGWWRHPIIWSLASLSLSHPFAFEEIAMGRPTQMFWLFSCLYLVGIHHLIGKHLTFKMGIATALALVGSCFVYWFGGVAIGFCGGVVYVLSHLGKIKKQDWKGLQWSISLGVLIALCALGVTLLFTWRLSSAFLQGGNTFNSMQIAQLDTANIMGLQMPIYSKTTIHSWSQVLQIIQNHPTPLPILILGFCGILFPIQWPTRLPIMIAWILSLGIPLVGAFEWHDMLIPTGQSWLQILFPPLKRCHDPERMMVAPTLMSLWLFGQTLHHMIQWKPQLWKIGLLLCMPFLYFQDLPKANDLNISSFVIDEFRLELSQIQAGAMIDAPLSRSENTYIQQLFHKQPILGGPGLNRVQPQEHIQYIEGNAFLMGVEELTLTGQSSIVYQQQDIDALIKDGFVWLIVDPKAARCPLSDVKNYLNIQGSQEWIQRRTGIQAFRLVDIQASKY